MTDTKMMKAVNDEMLTIVVGGNDGDSKYEHDNDLYLYNIGDIVEVYLTGYHITTRRAKIIDISTESKFTSWKDWSIINAPYYMVLYENNKYEWVFADSIERK